MQQSSWPTCVICLDKAWIPSQLIGIHSSTEGFSCKDAQTYCYECLKTYIKDQYIRQKNAYGVALKCPVCSKVDQQYGLAESFDSKTIIAKHIQVNYALMKMDEQVYPCYLPSSQKCSFQGTQEELFRHSKECMNRMVKCSHCQKEHIYHKEAWHHTVECDAFKTCHDCIPSKRIKKEVFEQHRLDAHDKIQCKWCKLGISSKYMESHMHRNCPKGSKTRACPLYAEYQCMSKIRQSDLLEHLKSHLRQAENLKSLHKTLFEEVDQQVESTSKGPHRQILVRHRKHISRQMQEHGSMIYHIKNVYRNEEPFPIMTKR